MNKKEGYPIYIIFMLVYTALAIYNYQRGAQWLIDNVVAMAILTSVFLIRKRLKMGKFEFMLANIALLIHNLGTFGFYAWKWGSFTYDNAVHLIISSIVAYVIFNFIAQKLQIREKQRKNAVINERTVIFVFLVIASVAMLGSIVELIEYAGFMYFGPGEGLFFYGAGDGNVSDVAGQYIDTMGDILMNTIGSIIGFFLYYHTKYKKKRL